MSRILRIITRLNVGGPATHVVLANRGLTALGWETLLVHGDVDAGEIEVPLDDVGIDRIRVPSLVRPIRPASDAAALVRLARIIRRYRPDIIHTHLSKAGLIGRLAARAGPGAATVHTFHGTVFGGYFGERASTAIVRAERFLGHRTDRIVALSERQRTELLASEVTFPDRIRIIPLGLDLTRFASRDQRSDRVDLGIPDDVILVVAVGRMVPIKRLDRLVRVFAGAAATDSRLRLAIVGDGPDRAATELLADSLRVADRVEFRGWTAQTPAWYSAADIVVLTSDREGTPLALIEAAAAGRPVVAVNVGGVADVVDDGVTGFVVEPDDEAGFIERLLRLAKDPALRQSLGRAAPGKASGYDAARLVSDLDALYRELL